MKIQLQAKCLFYPHPLPITTEASILSPEKFGINVMFAFEDKLFLFCYHLAYFLHWTCFPSGLLKSPLRNAPDHVMSLVMTAIPWKRLTVVYYNDNLQDVLYKATKSLFL